MAEIKLTDRAIQVDDNTSTYTFDFSRVYPYSADIKDYDIEHIFADLRNNYLIIALTVASGQSGIIAVVDISTDEIVHIQGGAFAVSAFLAENNVISLNYISVWGQPAHYTIEVFSLGNMNMNAEGKSKMLPNDIEFNNDNISLSLEGSALKIFDGEVNHIENISELL